MPETKLTVILPDEAGQIEQTGTVIAQRGDLAVMHRFTFASGQGMVRLPHIIPDVTAKLTALEANPPPVASTDGADERRVPDKPAAKKKSPSKKQAKAKTSARKASSKATKAAAEDDETPDWMKPFGSGVKPIKPSAAKKAN